MSTAAITPAGFDADGAREELIRQRLAGRRSGRRNTIPRADRSAPLRLSHGQEQMWFLSRLDPDSTQYLVPLIVRLTGELNTAALAEAWQRLTDRHEILRTRYGLDGEDPVQLISPAERVILPLEDLSALPADEREARVQSVITDDLFVPIDLARDLPVRARLIRLADDEHVLAIVFHHIACDAWSTEVIGRELSTLYTALAAGTEPDLPPVAVQYADFAAWQRTELSGAALQAQLDYWKTTLAGLTPIELPTDRPRRAVRDATGATVAFTVPDSLADRLREFAQHHDATPFMVVLTAFQSLLARYTGTTDIAVGTVVSGRGRPELQGMVGFGINSLVLRGNWSGDPSFRELLGRTRDTVLGAFDHQSTPFAQLIDVIQPERDLSRTPLFDVALTMHGERTSAFTLPGLRAEPFRGEGNAAKYDLDLQLREAADGTLHGHLEYAVELFDRESAERLTAHLVRLLDAAVTSPDTGVAELGFLGESELALLTAGAAVSGEVTGTVHQVFEAQARRTPDAVAVHVDGHDMTYAELNARANRVAHHLRGIGVGPETLVGVCLERGPDLLPALLGVLKAGGAYLPLDPSVPADRIGFMLEDAAVPVVVTESAHQEMLSGVHTGSLLVLDRDREALAGQPDTDPAPAGDADGLIYVIYTSGSTGRPKGVCLTHANVLRLFTVTAGRTRFHDTDVWTLFHSYAFDFSVWEMWGALLHGGAVVVVPKDVARDPDRFLDLLVDQRVTVLNQTPSAFRSLVGAAREGDPRIDRLALRTVVFGGEKLEVADLRPWADRLGLAAPTLVNMYGITETTVHVTHHELGAADLAGAGSPVGVPLDDLSIRILDRHGNPAPIGVPGEIHVAGRGIARGYLGRPGLTAERFVPDEFGAPGDRLYRSGDVARRLADGSLEFLGRNDEQVKIRGFRIELGEINAALAAQDGVLDAVVLVRETSPGDKQLVAYVVPADPAGAEPAAGPDTDTLRTALARDLPDYMVPAAFVVLERLPLTVNGKLDTKALPAPGPVRAAGKVHAAPRTALEHRVAAIWRDVLGVDPIGVHDSFFDLGGHSLRAINLAGHLREAGLDVSVRDIFEHRTVALLAERLTGRPEVRTARGVRPFALVTAEDRERLPEGLDDAYPMSQVQIGMVVEMLSDTGRHPYHNVTSFRIRDERPFDVAALRASVRSVIDRHDVLRTSFDLNSYAVPMQLVHSEVAVPVTERDLRGLTDDEVRSSLREFTRRERAELIGLDTPPLLRLIGHSRDDGSWWLTITENHAILDGWSHHSLLMEIVEGYRTARDGRAIETPAAPDVRFADFIAAEVASREAGEDRAYWSGIVQNYPAFALPDAWSGDGEAGAPYRVKVPFHDLEDRLRALASAAGASLKSVLHAAHLKVMSSVTGDERFFTGLVCNARPEALGADGVYGMHLNTLPFAFDGATGTWRELVERVFGREVDLWPHRGFPMPDIQREAEDGQRLVSVRFSYHDFDQVDREQVDYLASIDDSPTEFPLGVSARLGHLFLTGGRKHLSEVALHRLAGTLRQVLEAMAADPEGDATASYLPAAERERLLAEGTGERADFGSATVLRRFEEQALRTPDAPAVGFGGVSLSYAELDARANQMAHHLLASGAGPESVVGVLLDRGPELLAGLLGVWKAGAAYVPVDPSYPAERIAAMLDSAGSVLAVTEEAYADRFGAVTTVLVDRDRSALDALPSTAPERHEDADALAYTIFTSGSTGRPKGVGVPHRGLANHVGWAVRDLASRGTTGAPLFSSVAFDLVVPNLWAPLVTGQQVHTVPQDTDIADLGAVLAEAGPYSFIKLTPGHLDVLAEQLTAEQASALAPVLVVAGEAFTRATLDRWRALAPATRLINEYGPTEASVGTCVHPVPENETAEVLPIGHPLPNMTMYVLDAGLSPVSVGVPGELYVGGTGVARGYAGRPDLTAERFVPDPFGPAGARLYRTGDLARTRADGAVEFLGRLDDQVKIRGYRIEPGEIQTVVAEHSSVRDAVVVPLASDTGDLRLVAYYVPVDGTEVTAADLGAHCEARLPDYMLPQAYVPLAEIPLNANGKTDRRALPAPGADELDGDSTYVAPRTLTEAQVAAIWCTVLERDRVGVEDGFFDLGGHSIRAVALVGALRAAGFDVGVREVFEYRTVAQLSEFLTGRPAPAEAAPPVEPFALLADEDRARLPEGVVDAYPMSQVQLGMLVEMLADQEKRAYLNVASFRITDGTPFDGAALRRALDVVTGRHEMLRTSFHLDSFTTPLQLVAARTVVPLAVEDLRGAEDRGQRVADIMAEERSIPFDLATAPLLRMTAQVEDEGSWRLVVTVCHAITEGWSHRALLMELLDVYRELRDGLAPAAFTAPPVRYADFIAAELASLESAADRDYWKQVIGGYAPFALPPVWQGDASAPREKYRAAVPVHDLEPRLRALATSAQVSFKSVLLAAHLKVMSMVTEEDAFFSGLVCSARPESPGAERVYGMYLNTLPFAFDRASGSWSDLVRQVFAREAEVWDHRRFPMPVIQRDADLGRLLHVRFSYQDFDHVDTSLVDAEASSGEGGTEFALAVSAVSGHLLLTTHTHALGREHADRLTGLYRQVLEAMAADPRGSAEQTFLPAGEREWLAEQNATGREFGELTVLRRFEEQAARTPDAVAVRHRGEETGYAELDARANRIAHRLRAAGIGAESTVGVLLDRSPGLIATLLGVWKAGGAYVPIDPSYPAERIASMCESAGAVAAVTEPSYADGFPAGVPVLLLDELERTDTDVPAGAPPGRGEDPDRLAYVIFTSGSTGRPKGVQIPHRGLANHVAWAAEDLASRGTGGAPLFSSVAFDLVVPNLWGPLVTGQAVHVVAQDTAPAELSAALLGSGPYSFIKLTPGHLDILTEQLTTEQVDRLSQVYVVAGEALPGETANRSLEVLGEGRMINEYGPTEASVGSTVLPVTSHVALDVVPIGRPLPNMTVHVLDASMRPVPVGVLGELYVGGTGVARGYAGRPDLTAERFVPDPFGPAGARLYRTGDRARLLADGNVEFLGRLDDQVKIRGYRIELGEVQAVVTAHPAVRDAVVTVHEPTPGDKRLVAYCVPVAGQELPSASVLADDCARHLPEYMVPAAFVALESIPLNANGKVDRRALAAPDRSSMRSEDAYVAPRTATERLLAKIWSEVLGVDQIGVHDKFFELGGHSILMIQVLAAARREGLAVSVWRMYQHGTLIDLAAAIDEDTEAARRAAEPEPEPVVAAEAAPAEVVMSAELLATLLEQASGGDRSRLAEGPLAQVAALLEGAGTTGPDTAAAPAAFPLDELRALMAEHQVPGVSIAVLGADGSTELHGAGVLSNGGSEPVTPHTLFQVGSISKHVTALAALRLVAEGRIALDDPIERHLTSWRLPDLASAPGEVTIRHLLGHTAGLARHRSVGFPPGEEVPTLLDLLSGTGPVTTPQVGRQLVPGSTFRKSSTHYWVLQQLLEDVTGESFQRLMERLVFGPLEMTGSSFDQAFPLTAGRPVALGHHARGVALDGGWRNRAHLAAAGLWTTAGDIAAVARQMRASLLGLPGALLPAEVAGELLTGHPGSFYGLGTIVDDTGDDAEFGHGGEPAGYWNLSLSHLGSGVGLVALTNSDSGKGVVKHLTATLSRREQRFGRGTLMADWAAAGTGDQAPGNHPLLSPVITEEDRA
ncbi:amino acid adenylation domain-containing protein [Streptomyces sp. BE147]|uniref:non-ribosomal peptide synthetase n=1 Tax=Streptomyces sp. BE147 TaxID=3002524 RepID=UPI002E790A2C|nr:non-ribosomal peptide synthetase [Streptomyces sp. BE147]MEE1738089.1 amino acid adenylation domain-containing protein [Streptomyces sp. BE147]